MPLEFWITTLIVVATPGTGVLVTLAAALSRGPRAAVVAAAGCTLGILPHMLAAITGLAALLHASALAFQAIKYLGVAYLLYMAWMVWRERGPLRIEAAGEPPRSDRKVIVSAILVNILNPKLSIFFFAFLPQFVRADDPAPALRMLELSIAFMAVTFAVFVAYGVFAAAMRSLIVGQPLVLLWMRRSFAAAFMALGARLALAER